MAKAKKLPSGNYRCLACKAIGGKKINKSFTAATKKEAELLALEWQNENSINDSSITLSKAIDNYIALRRNTVSPVTIKTYEGYKKRYLTEYQGKSVSYFNTKVMQTVVNDLSAKLSPKTVKSVYSFYSSVLSEYGIKCDATLPKIYKPIYNTPPQDIGKKILEAVKDTDVELPVNLALKCGLRISEVCGLKWSAIHDDYIVIDNVIVSFGKEQIEKAPKSSAGKRKIPVSKDVLSLINSQPKINEYVYQKNAKAIGSSFRRVLKKNDLPHVKFHELRHAFASNMALLGIPENYAKAIGGWDTSEILHQIYEQTYKDEEMKFAKKIQGFYD